MEPNVNGGQNLRVNVASIIDQIHSRYTKQIAQLVQENSELAAGQDALSQENAELRSKLAALTG
jgi:cell division protein FtsB